MALDDEFVIDNVSKYLKTHYEKPCRIPKCTTRTREMLEEFSIKRGWTRLDSYFENMDLNFAETLFAFIDEKGLTDAECYKRANLDRKLFSKIRNTPHYQPKKTTAVALAIALQLDIKETLTLLKSAGYTLSNSDMFDVIIQYFIQHKYYDILKINRVLHSYKQPILGSM